MCSHTHIDSVQLEYDMHVGGGVPALVDVYYAGCLTSLQPAGSQWPYI